MMTAIVLILTQWSFTGLSVLLNPCNIIMHHVGGRPDWCLVLTIIAVRDNLNTLVGLVWFGGASR